MRNKALLAIAFAGSVLTAPGPVSSQNEVKTLPSESEAKKSSGNLSQDIANNTQLPADFRAYYLLQLASRYLDGVDRDTAEADFKSIATRSGDYFSRKPDLWESTIENWVELVSKQGRKNIGPENSHTNPQPNSTSSESKLLANNAIGLALAQLDNSSAFARVNMYFIASHLYQSAGNDNGMQKCKKYVDTTLNSCGAGKTPVSADQIKGCASLLNSMASNYINVQISDNRFSSSSGLPPVQAVDFSEKDFASAEKLKLRAISFVDKLPSANHIRRKAHRDLALWYWQLGKKESFNREKQVLFELVGTTDDRILYPVQAGCGHVVWWKVNSSTGGCGMG